MRTITEDAGSLASATVVAGVGAAVVSLVQCALGLVVGVDDPAQTVAAIRQALGTTG